MPLVRASFLLSLASFSLPFVFAACGGVVAPDPGGGGAKPTPTTGPTTTPTSGPSPTPTSTPTSTPVPPTSCAETSDRLHLSVSGLGHEDACPSPSGERAPHQYDVQGSIHATRAGGFAVDTCGPAADCAGPILFDVDVEAPGVDLSGLPLGSYVDVHVMFASPFGCESSIVVTSLDTWEGDKNPVDSGGHVYFAGADGLSDAAGAPFKVVPVALHCKPPTGPSCGSPADDYALTFDAGTGAPLQVGMGETKFPFFLPGGDTLMVRNLRSFSSGACDANFDWGWWAVRDTAMPD